MQFLILALTVCLLLAPLPAWAQVPRAADVVSAQVRNGWQAETGAFLAGVELRLAPGWITYWRHPGESGLVPQLDWSRSRNVANARIVWPEPRLYSKAGFASIGYSGNVVLPIEITPSHPGQPVDFSAILSLGVCEDVCIPVDLTLQTTLNGKGAYDREIAGALDRRPGAARAAGLRSVDCAIRPEGKAMRLTANLQIPRTGIHEFVLVELPGQAMRVLPSERSGETLIGHGLMRSSGASGVDRSAVRLSVVSERGTVVHQGCAISD